VSPDREQAAADLAALDRDRAALAEKVLQPWWFDAALGLLLFGFLSVQALDSTWVTAPALLVFAGGLGLLVRVYRARSGVWVHTPATVLLGWGALVLVVLVPAFLLSSQGHRWVMVVAGAVLGLAVALLSRHWGRTWQRELREGV
jgi:peptidoglycan/LPS O-acetylase OafA/YrhL